MTRRNSLRWIIALLIASIQVFVILWLFMDWGYDDPYITFRYAENLHSGHGFVYNIGEKVLSTTTPLFAILLSLLSFLWSNIPSIASVIGAISLSVGGLLLWDLANTLERPFAGWFVLIFYPIFPLLLSTLSSETPFYLALCIGAFAFYSRRRFNLAAVFTALAILTRPDAILIALVLSLDYFLQYRRLPPKSSLITFFTILLPWIILATIYFGSPIPVTLIAKQNQGAMAISQRFAPGLLTILRYWYIERWFYWLGAGLAIVGIISSVKDSRGFRLFLGWILIYFIAYTTLGVSRYFWYYAPLALGFIVAVGLGIDFIIQSASEHIPNLKGQIRIIGVITLVVSTSFFYIKEVREIPKHSDDRLRIYRAVGQWINSNTESEAGVGALEVGIIGYYSKRKMIDFAGIIQPSIAEQLSPSTTYEDATSWGIQRFHPKYLVLNPDWFPELMKITVHTFCEPIRQFVGEEYGYSGSLSIYQCEW